MFALAFVGGALLLGTGWLGVAPAASFFATATPTNLVLFDDFADPDLSWLPAASAEPSRYARGVDRGEYVFRGLTRNLELATSYVPGQFADAAIEADVRVVAGTPDDAYVDLGCRHWFIADTVSGYRLTIKPGFSLVALNRLDQNRVTPLREFDVATAIQRGGATNRVRLTCRAASIVAHVNGAEVARATDGAHPRGHLFLGAQTRAPAEVRFDNLAVFKTGQ